MLSLDWNLLFTVINLVIFYILIFRAKLCDPVAAILPLLFAQVSLKLIEFFRKDPAKSEKDGDSTP